VVSDQWSVDSRLGRIRTLKKFRGSILLKYLESVSYGFLICSESG